MEIIENNYTPTLIEQGRITMDTALIQVLEQACSQDPKDLKPAEQTLKQWETERGFYTALYSVFSNHSLPINVRWIAVIYFKNGVERYWRKTAPNAIAEDEKEFLRQRLIANFEEPADNLAIQVAVVISRIARLDCPREWNTLIPTLLETTGSQSSLGQHRAMLTLHRVIKALSCKCLPEDTRLFRELAANISNFILNLWNTYIESFLILASNGAEVHQLREQMEKAFLLLKILRLLTVQRCKSSYTQQEMLFFEVIFERAKTTLECRKTLMSRGIHMEVCDKFIIHLTKVLLGVLEDYPTCYAELIPRSLEFIVFYCFTDAGQPLTFERFNIQCLRMLKGILLLKPPKMRLMIQTTPCRQYDDFDRVDRMRKDFFTDEILREISYRLVTHYFLLTPADLELWDTDPENFAVEDVREAWKYSLRRCTEPILMALIYYFDNVPTSVLRDLLQRHHQPVDPNDLPGILVKDAVYHAVGLSSFFLDTEVDIEQWFSTVLKEELKVRDTNYRIIRRRVCWLIGRWINSRLSPKLRLEAYELIVLSLGPGEDLCVRLAASDALKLFIDSFDFNTAEFEPFLEKAFYMLFTLLKEIDESDSKMRVLCGMSFMIKRVGCDIKPHLNSFVAFLPELWQHSEEHNMLRCAIASTLVHLARALGPDNVTIEPLVVAVVGFSCDVNQDGHVYLMEDGLELWLALLETASVSTPGIMGLLKNIPALLDCSTENLRLWVDILKAYVLLNPMEFLCEYGALVVDTIKSRISDMNEAEIVVVLRLFETCLTALPQQSTQLIKPLLGKIFENVYRGTEDFEVLLMCLCIVARVLLFSREIFAQVISELVRDSGGDATEESVLGRMIEVWVTRMSTLETELLRIPSLGLCSLLSPNSPPIIYQQFPQMICSIVEALNDLDYSDFSVPSDQPSTSEHLSIPDDDTIFDTEHERRVDKLMRSDPARNVSIKYTLQNQLITLRRVMGDEQFQQMLLTLGADMEKQLKVYVTL